MAHSNQTKKALAAAMKDLMQQRPFAKINVGDICEACGLGRKSFYYHFRDKYDLVNWIFQTEFIAVAQAGAEEDSWGMLRELCRYFYANRAFYRNALEVTGQNSFPEYFQETMQPLIQVMVAGFMDERDQSAEFAAQFYTDAFLCAIVRWLSARTSMEPERFIQMLSTTLSLGARCVMERSDRKGLQSIP